MPPWSGEIPPGYIDPSLLFLGADGQVYLHGQEGAYLSEADHISSSHESVSSSHTDTNSGNEHRAYRVSQVHGVGQAFNWNMSAVFAYDAQIRAEQALRHQRTIEIARQIYAARIGHTYPEDSYNDAPVETRIIPWPASERSLTDVIELLQFEKSITRVGCQRWEVIRAWLGWAEASKEKRHTIQLDQVRNVHRFLEQKMDESDRADQMDTDGIEDFKMEVDGSEAEDRYPIETSRVIIAQPDLGR